MTETADVSPPLSGCRVLDLSDRTGAYCTKVLADLGADVIKVELPAGDELRRVPPFRDGAALRDGAEGTESSLMFAYYHHNKRGITLDFRQPAAEPLLRELAAKSDVIIASPTRRQPVFGLEESSPALRWAGADRLTCFVTPFGMTGPLRRWRSTPFTSFAMSGYMNPVGPLDGPPLYMPGQQLFDESGVHLALLIQSLLLEPNGSGPRVVDHAVHDAGHFKKLALERYGLNGRIVDRATNFGPPPGGIWKTADGHVDIGCHSPRHWDIFVEVLGQPATLADELYRDRSMRAQLFDLVTSLIAEELAPWSAKEFVRLGQAKGLPCAVRQGPSDFVRDEQPLARGFFISSARPGTGEFPVPGPVFKSEPTMIAYTRSAPTLGESNDEIYRDELNHSASELADWRARELI
jgi:crotonobetainyl-CoA:carnitine CoA-transferase CaiB-like acyl-CoA transferase